jgi:hypothetical protein
MNRTLRENAGALDEPVTGDGERAIIRSKR